jgi:hypothetical protein
MPENIPPELMKLVQGQQGAQQPPRTSPMSMPQQNEGEKQGALPKVIMAMKVLESTLHILGADTDEGQAVLSALKILGSKFGEKSREKGGDMISSELANLVSGLPQGARGNVAPPQQPQQGMQPGAQPPQM